jgi:ATP-dependent Zn protease
VCSSDLILVELPDRAARKQYLVLRLRGGGRGLLAEAVIDLLVEKSVGMSIAALEQVLEAAARQALKKGVPVSDELLVEALDTAREGEAKEWSPEFLEGTARHEAGHTIMYWLSGWWAPEVSIIARADHGGGMRPSEQEVKRESLTREELCARIRTLLGGRAAEMLYGGREAGMTTGASSDLERATNIARQMICCYGMNEEFGLLSLPELFRHAEALGSPTYQRVNETAGRLLQEEMAKTQQQLEANRAHLEALVQALREKNRLYRKDLEQLLPALPGRAASA